jgi:hypothetical protein
MTVWNRIRLEKSPNNNLLLTVGFPTMFYSININAVPAVIYLVKDAVLPRTHSQPEPVRPESLTTPSGRGLLAN